MLELRSTLLPNRDVLQALCSRVDCGNVDKCRMGREDQGEWPELPCNLDMQLTSHLLLVQLLVLEQMLYILVYREERNDNELVETN